jgi:acetyltransferase-like isoleucine patch superfamily enzyme
MSSKPSLIHPTVEVGAFCCIDEDVEIGKGVVIRNYVELREGTKIGDRTFVDSRVTSSGDNQIGRDVTLRFGVVVAKKVVIGDGSFLSPGVMTTFSTHEGEEALRTVIGKDVFIGTGAVLGPGVSIADGCVIGALAYVSRDLMTKGVYVGVPARLLKEL